MDLALNNQQRLICHKPNQPTTQLTNHCSSLVAEISNSLAADTPESNDYLQHFQIVAVI